MVEFSTQERSSPVRLFLFMYVTITRENPERPLVSNSERLLLLPGERSVTIHVEELGSLVEVTRVAAERRLRAPPRCGVYRREIGFR